MSNKKGFTLIELLIVVVIIGILAAIAIPKFANTKDKAYVAAMKSDLRNLATYEEQYAADQNGAYFAGTAPMATPMQGLTLERERGSVERRPLFFFCVNRQSDERDRLLLVPTAGKKKATARRVRLE